MPQELRHDVIQQIKDQKIEFIHLWFTDVLGFLKSFTIDVEELETGDDRGDGLRRLARSRASRASRSPT